jgi:hypothetical protein
VPKPLDTYTAYVDRGPGWWFFNLMKQSWFWPWLSGKDATNLIPADTLFTVKTWQFTDGSNYYSGN